jgi:hypothetical protein
MISVDGMHKAYESREWSSIKRYVDHASRCFRHHVENFRPMYYRYTLVPFGLKMGLGRLFTGLHRYLEEHVRLHFWCIGRGDWLGGAFGLRVKSIGLLQELKIYCELAWMAVNTCNMYTCVDAMSSVKFSRC